MRRFKTNPCKPIKFTRIDSARTRMRLEALYRIYRVPVLEYILRKGHDHAAAEDLAQTFFMHFLERAGYPDADPGRRQFRAYLMTALKRFLIDAYKKACAVKRGGHVDFKTFEDNDPFENDMAEVDSEKTPERVFERYRAMAAVDRAMNRLRRETARMGKREIFERMSQFLIEGPDASDYSVAASKLRLRRNTLAVVVHRLRHRLRELVREELAKATVSRAELKTKIRALRVTRRRHRWNR